MDGRADGRGVIATDPISKQRLGQKNRIALIVLDSTLKIAFQEYLVRISESLLRNACESPAS